MVVAVLALTQIVLWRRIRHQREPLIVPEGMATAAVAMTLVRRLAGDVLMLAVFGYVCWPRRRLSSRCTWGSSGSCSHPAHVHLRRARALERWERDQTMLVLAPGGLFSVEGLCAVPLASGR